MKISKHGNNWLRTSYQFQSFIANGKEDEIGRKLTAIIPKIRFALAVNAFPVPLSFVVKISGVYAYKTAYMILLKKLNIQFHPNNAPEVIAVVEAYRNTPVKIVLIASVPLLPRRGSSTR